MSNDKEFWNHKDIVRYFAEKPADPRIVDRLKKIGGRRNKTALDIGCGGGRHSELLAALGFTVTAIDKNPEMLRYTRNRLRRSGLSANIRLMAIENMAFRGETFDVVLSTGVIHQVISLDDYKKVLQSISDILKPGGLFTMNIFTNKVWDSTYTIPDPAEPYTVLTKEDLCMTLIPKELFYQLANEVGLKIETDLSEEIKNENTGPRAVFRAHFIKK